MHLENYPDAVGLISRKQGIEKDRSTITCQSFSKGLKMEREEDINKGYMKKP